MLQKLIDKITKAKNESLPFVVYNKPNSEEVSAFFQQNNQLIYQTNFEEPGFIFAPFDNYQPSIIFQSNKCEIYQTDFDNKSLIELSTKTSLDLIINVDTAKNNHVLLVEKGIDFLNQNNALKVVLSRKEEVNLKNIDVIDIFLKLLNQYTNAFVYLWYHPKVGLWMGASPETLLIVKHNKFKTMALAGTQPFKGSLDVCWGEKEKEEQQIVTDYIINQLTNFDISVSSPFTKKAGSLVHICTEIEGELIAKNQLKGIINKLHPTPAICGLPTDKAKNFIIENEDYKREFYTGYLGELNIKEQSHLFVNLRCMQINKQDASLYIGGGITKNSNPENEWVETVAKSEVMKRVLV
ncbi:MAG: isochorismate synthase [Flavobacteriaceae bacterium]|nr:isochorismate synthase [Flavobacteriaceae bacterium]